MKITYILCTMLFLAGCSSNTPQKNETDSSTNNIKNSENKNTNHTKRKKIKEWSSNDFKNEKENIGYIGERVRAKTELKPEDIPEKKNYSTDASANNSASSWKQSPGALTMEKKAAEDASKGNWAAGEAQNAIKSKRDKEMNNLIRDIEGDRQ